MSRLVGLLPLALGLLVAGCTQSEPEPATLHDPALIKALSEIPIQDQGRIKPLSTFADFTVLGLNGMRKVRVDLDAKDDKGKPKRKALTPIQWVARCLLFPEKARDDKVFLVAEKKALETLATLQLEDLDQRKRRDRYSYNELVKARTELIDQHELLRPRQGTPENPQVESKTLSPLEQQLVSLAENLVRFERLVHSLDFARGKLEIRGVVGFAFKDATPKIEGSARFSEVVDHGQRLAKTFFDLQRATSDQIDDTLKREQLQELNRFTRAAEDLGRSAQLLACFAPNPEVRLRVVSTKPARAQGDLATCEVAVSKWVDDGWKEETFDEIKVGQTIGEGEFATGATLLDVLSEGTAIRVRRASGQEEVVTTEVVIPPTVWDSPYSLLVTCVKEGSQPYQKQIAAMRAFEDLVSVRDDTETLTKRVVALREALAEQAQAHGQYSKVPLEVSYYRMDLLYRAQILFVFGFVFVALTWLVDPKRLVSRILTWGTLGLTTTALGMLIVGITIRCILRGRPPVTTLYETILFICACGVLTALGLEWVNRQRVGLALAPFLGGLLLFLANRYELSDAKDTMPQLVAVLDTNFWLSTHVTTVTLGYAAGLLAGVIGHVYLIGRLAHWFSGGKWFSDPAAFRNLAKLTYGVIGFGLVFSTVGTILGGIWANDSWGRFWGWDPKENGALLIVLWELAILHGRMGGHLREFGVCYTAAIGTAVVAFSWWGVNLLGVGLHSYGFTGGVAKVLYAYYGLEGVFVLVVAGAWLARRFGGRKPLHIKPAPAPAA